jgi:ribosome-associated translation inhibitor RaiA
MNFELQNFEKQETKELFYPQIEYRREQNLEIISKLLNGKDKSRELLGLLDLADEETIYWLTMTFNHPEREKDVFNRIQEQKEHIKDISDIQKRLFDILSLYKNENISQNSEVDLEDANSGYEERVKKLIDYFQPIDFESRITKIIKVYSDNIVSKNSGRAITIDRDVFILSHSDNKEFLHTIINPIVDKLSEQLTNFEKNKLKEIIHLDLKKDYGDHFESLMCESIIRIYNDFFKHDSEKYAGGFKNFELGNKIYYLFQKYTEQELEKAVDFETFLLNNKDILLS